MVDIHAEVILRSQGPTPCPGLTTFLVRYPRIVHAEHMRHRTGSYSVSSSRAIPVSKMLEEARSDKRAGPVYWGTEKKGMSSGDELVGEDVKKAEAIWRTAAWNAAFQAEELQKLGVHKSITNRLIEPFLHVNVLLTSCDPGLLNFFGLRLDKAAQPEIRALAEEMWRVWNEGGSSQNLANGEWHLPFIDEETRDQVFEYCEDSSPAAEAARHLGTKNGFDRLFLATETEEEPRLLLQISAARCARLSYRTGDISRGVEFDIAKDLEIYNRLLGSQPIHASPAEHQATPDVMLRISNGQYEWEWPDHHGNLEGWLQFRKFLVGEAVAPLPEGYKYL